MLYLELLVHRFNNEKLKDLYLQKMVTSFCEINWPVFITMKEVDKTITTYQFLKRSASKIPLLEARESASGQISNIVLSGKGTLTNAYEKVMGSHHELKRGYDFLVSDTEVLKLIPIGKYSLDSNPHAEDITDIERFIY
jgi:hypothetical protein